MKIRRGVAVAILVLGLKVADVALAMPAFAFAQPAPEWPGQPNTGWEHGRSVGYAQPPIDCMFDPTPGGYTGPSNYALEIQGILWADNDFNVVNNLGINNIDGWWGHASDQALKEYQWKSSLPEDGCAGWNTLVDMQRGDFLHPQYLCQAPLNSWMSYRWDSGVGQWLGIEGSSAYNQTFVNVSGYMYKVEEAASGGVADHCLKPK